MEGPKISVTPPGPKAQEFIERDKKVMSPSLTRTAPLVGVEAEDVWVKDIDGNVFLDFSSGIAVTNIGHKDPRVVNSIKKQSEKAIHINSCDFYTVPQVELAEKLFEVTPGDFKKRIFFTNSGTEAVEAALKVAQWHTQNYYVISFVGGFHGRTMGSLQLTTPGTTARRHFKGMMPGTYHTPYPYCYRCPFKLDYPNCDLHCLDYIEDTVLGKLCPSEDTSCLIIEPIQGAAGYIVPPDEFMPRLAELCKKHGIMLVADEIQTGFGRSGEWFACDHWDVKPDIITISKAIASGLPCGAAISRAELMDWDAGAHENTLGGNPVVTSASLSVLDAMKSDELVENSAEVGNYLLDRFEELAEDHSIIGDVRGRGLMIGLELVKDRETKEPAKEERSEIMRKAFKRGLILLGAGVSSLRLAPPLTLTKEQADTGLRIFEDALSEVED
ncbi:MAG: acetyl ornithine aminotransferase family protein [Hadesarchaea archaeon]|nr:acetyl ornithine aminotransferase family protein [Hadesarchaea archaeon]